MRIGALVSGGKDSLMAAYKVSCGNYRNKLACLITIKSRNPDSYMFHTPNVEMVRLQAEAAGIPLVWWETEGVKEEELEDLRRAIEIAREKYRIEGIVSGAIKSSYQKERVDKICRELRLSSLAPLWQANEEIYLHQLMKNFNVIITGIAAEGLKKELLGTRIGLTFFERIKQLNVSPAGEGGEIETLVLDCPLFRKRIIIKEAHTQMESECCGVYVIRKAELADK